LNRYIIPNGIKISNRAWSEGIAIHPCLLAS
jgi:hypothetical protein